MSSVMDCNELYERAMVVAFDLHVFGFMGHGSACQGQ